MTIKRNRTAWIFLPVVTLWQLVAFILILTGRLVGIVLGLVLIAVGVLLNLTVVGAVLGVPMMALGLLLIAKGLF